MKNCPFCGATGVMLHQAMIRIVCLECGASGPVSETPEASWNLREDDLEELDLDPEKVLQEVQGWLLEARSAPITIDGTRESVHLALDKVFERTGAKAKQ